MRGSEPQVQSLPRVSRCGVLESQAAYRFKMAVMPKRRAAERGLWRPGQGSRPGLPGWLSCSAALERAWGAVRPWHYHLFLAHPGTGQRYLYASETLPRMWAIFQILKYAVCIFLIADIKSKVHWMGLLGFDASFLVPHSFTTPRLCLQGFLCTIAQHWVSLRACPQANIWSQACSQRDINLVRTSEAGTELYVQGGVTGFGKYLLDTTWLPSKGP